MFGNGILRESGNLVSLGRNLLLYLVFRRTRSKEIVIVSCIPVANRPSTHILLDEDIFRIINEQFWIYQVIVIKIILLFTEVHYPIWVLVLVLLGSMFPNIPQPGIFLCVLLFVIILTVKESIHIYHLIVFYVVVNLHILI